MLTKRQTLEKPFVTLDGCVDLVRMANSLTPIDFRQYIDLCREDRRLANPKEFKAGRFNS
jgi:hypothetical protein